MISTTYCFCVAIDDLEYHEYRNWTNNLPAAGDDLTGGLPRPGGLPDCGRDLATARSGKYMYKLMTYRQVSNIRRTLVGN